MKETFFKRHYGKVIALPVYFCVLIFGYLGVNLIYNQYLIDKLSVSQGYSVHVRDEALIINVLMWLIVTALFLITTAFRYRKNENLFLILFVPSVVLFQFFLSSTLVDFAEKSENYEYNPDGGVIWVVIYPLNVIMLLILGAVFDRLKNANRIKNASFF